MESDFYKMKHYLFIEKIKMTLNILKLTSIGHFYFIHGN